MQTRLPTELLATDAGRQADTILRSCVHCGFCTATCPTFLVTGNELDSPRGRIYLVKELLERGEASRITLQHLDRCLSCQSCETTCPSNVRYHTLLNIGRKVLSGKVRRPLLSRMKRGLVLAVLGSGKGFAMLTKTGRLFRFLLPTSLARQLPGQSGYNKSSNEQADFERKVVLLGGCVQSSLSPDTNLATRKVLHQLGIQCIEITQESCCGAMHYHADYQDKGLQRASKLLEQIDKALADGAEAVISTASGCGNFIKDYQQIFTGDRQASRRLKKIGDKVQDIGEFLDSEDVSRLNAPGNEHLAFHAPCTLQHGQKLGGKVSLLLKRLGFTLAPVDNSHLCCGSAGTYSLFEPKMAKRLRDDKLQALAASGGSKLATANIGCQCHLAGGTDRDVRHWIEYVAEGLGESPG